MSLSSFSLDVDNTLFSCFKFYCLLFSFLLDSGHLKDSGHLEVWTRPLRSVVLPSWWPPSALPSTLVCSSWRWQRTRWLSARAGLWRLAGSRNIALSINKPWHAEEPDPKGSATDPLDLRRLSWSDQPPSVSMGSCKVSGCSAHTRQVYLIKVLRSVSIICLHTSVFEEKHVLTFS